MELASGAGGEGFEAAALLFTPADDAADDVVGFAKRHATGGEQVRQLGGEAEVAVEVSFESIAGEGESAPDASGDADRRQRGIDSVEQRLTVFL